MTTRRPGEYWVKRIHASTEQAAAYREIASSIADLLETGSRNKIRLETLRLEQARAEEQAHEYTADIDDCIEQALADGWTLGDDGLLTEIA